jgi:hypothetical protein
MVRKEYGMPMMDIEMPLDMVSDEPEAIQNFSSQIQAEVIIRLLERGSIETAFQAILFLVEEFDLATAIQKPDHLTQLIDEMVRKKEALHELVVVVAERQGGLSYLFHRHYDTLQHMMYGFKQRRINRYWIKLIEYELGRRDTSRAFELIKEGLNGFLMGQEHRFELDVAAARPYVDRLYTLMREKGQLVGVPDEPENQPIRVTRVIKERHRGKQDALGRRRKKREYQLRGKADGLKWAEMFRIWDPENKWQMVPAGNKILIIAAYFAKKKQR